jgi:hypothetical protein
MLSPSENLKPPRSDVLLQFMARVAVISPFSHNSIGSKSTNETISQFFLVHLALISYLAWVVISPTLLPGTSSPVLLQRLHWLPIDYRINFKLLSLPITHYILLTLPSYTLCSTSMHLHVTCVQLIPTASKNLVFIPPLVKVKVQKLVYRTIVSGLCHESEAVFNPSRGWYQFIDPWRMKGLVGLGGCEFTPCPGVLRVDL